MDRQQLEKLNNTPDQARLVFEWVKTGVIDLTEFKCFLLDVLHHGKSTVRAQNCAQEDDYETESEYQENVNRARDLFYGRK